MEFIQLCAANLKLLSCIALLPNRGSDRPALYPYPLIEAERRE